MIEFDKSYIGDGIYKEVILDHFKHPRNFGKLENPTVKSRDSNPLCGDEIEIQLEIKNDEIKNIKFQGKGCAISQASASMLTENVKEKTIEEVKAITREDIVEMLNIPIGPVRIKCALLSLIVLRNCINSYGDKNV